MTKKNWMLLSVDDIALLIVRNGKDVTYRQQKHYYKQTGNTIMTSRLEQAEILAQKIITEIDNTVARIESGSNGK